MTGLARLAVKQTNLLAFFKDGLGCTRKSSALLSLLLPCRSASSQVPVSTSPRRLLLKLPSLFARRGQLSIVLNSPATRDRSSGSASAASRPLKQRRELPRQSPPLTFREQIWVVTTQSGKMRWERSQS